MVSVIVPVYNVEKYIDRCVESLVKQTFADIEILWIDDGSTDSSSKRCDDWAQRDARVRAIHKENGGLSSARNCGLDHALGEYLLFVDSDDFVAPGYVERLYHEMAGSQTDIVICNYLCVDESGKEVNSTYYTYVQTMEPFSNITALMLFEDQSYGMFFDVVWNKIYKKELFSDIRFPEGVSLVEDIYVMPKLYYAATGISVISDKLYYYVFREGSLSHGTFNSSEDYLLRKPMMESRLRDYIDWGIKELILIQYIHLCSLILQNDSNSKAEIQRLQKEYRSYYFSGKYVGKLAFGRRLKYLLAAINLRLYHKIASKKWE